MKIIYPTVQVDMEQMIEYSKKLMKYNYEPLNFLLNDSGYMKVSWKNGKSDMQKLSTDLPDLIFELQNIDEKNVYNIFWKNGKFYEECAEIIFSEFDETKFL